MHAQDPSTRVSDQGSTGTRAPGGRALFAGAMLVVAGIWNGLIGFAGLVHDTLFVRVDGYLYTVDLTVWGWAHLFAGAALAGVGVAVRRGLPWARATGIVVVGVSLLINFLFLPYHPVWSVLVIALGVAIVIALATDEPRTA
jgi:hypothetical protein